MNSVERSTVAHPVLCPVATIPVPFGTEGKSPLVSHVSLVCPSGSSGVKNLDNKKKATAMPINDAVRMEYRATLPMAGPSESGRFSLPEL